ncbi:heparinase II/III domain-containing protein [Paenibacillus sp.]|uniref:heparinase II/III domain-containing protein n=1 Tax=Paenibacillus sp. TaxID=58172 RepID=UPI002D2E503C|nr:heparinase II/III family protein [Paenibacillus sp.]HZG84031.1 heparinase II/III family protein [Paenibacillus sp.]
MIQFSEQEVSALRQKAASKGSIVKKLLERSEPVLRYGIKIPDKGIATWTLYYYCPVHSVQLEVRYEEGQQHKCPICNKIYTGEPYDGAWWRFINGVNADSCFDLALLWMLTGEEKYKDLAEEILVRYATYYPSYEIHGGIPYNNPGKANAQTLCESMWIRSLAMGYDIIKDDLSMENKILIEKDLFTECAELLVKYRMDQIHNHEVLVGGALGILGVLLSRPDYVDFALHSKYGLAYQLEHAVLEDDFWFEGTFHYHYFALEAFMTFEKFARHTPYGLLQRPEYRRMLKMPMKLLQPGLELPKVGDGVGNILQDHLPEFYEFAYAVYGDWEFAWMLNNYYQTRERDNLEAFLYGVEVLPETPEYELEDYHDNEASGFTVFRGNGQKYLLMKHGKYGGEHDHYDKLGIHFSAYGEEVAPDLGTTGYGAPLHYEYYKNTATHNTVAINGANQPPANGRTIRYDREPDQILLEAEAVWDGSFPGIDSLTRVEWDEASYAGVLMRRLILWRDRYFIEAFLVKNVAGQTVDWILHSRGERHGETNTASQKNQAPLGTNKPLKYIREAERIKPEGVVHTRWQHSGCTLSIFSFCDCENQVIYAKGPDNPSSGELSYLLNRVESGTDVLYVNVFEAYNGDQPYILEVAIESADARHVKVVITCKDGMKKHEFEIGIS